MKTARHNTMSRKPVLNEKGFSLIEVIVALVVLTIGILAVNAMQTVSIRGNKMANDITEATAWSSDEVERILAMDYDDLVDTNGNGVGPDVNKNNIDDDDEGMAGDGVSNFGLDETAVFDGDVSGNDSNGDFTIVYNVAEGNPAVPMDKGNPLPNIKTVHVIVSWTDRGTSKSVTIRHKKAKFM